MPADGDRWMEVGLGSYQLSIVASLARRSSIANAISSSSIDGRWSDGGDRVRARGADGRMAG